MVDQCTVGLMLIWINVKKPQQLSYLLFFIFAHGSWFLFIAFSERFIFIPDQQMMISDLIHAPSAQR